ncbi:hypothetical protein [Celeribacter sp.]|uniref:hypothetical protein n=1 Tax=Celeribacter sp. TaxID=1890673 RepID=UPI003A911BCB
MTNKFVDQYINSGTPSGYEKLRNVRAFGPFWTALLQATKSKDGNTTRFSLTSLGTQHENPQLAAVSAYAIRHDGFGLQSETTVFVKGIGDSWLRNLQPIQDDDDEVVARRQPFDAEQQMILTPVTDWPDGDPSLRLPAFKLVEGAIPVDVTDRALGILQSLLGASRGNLAQATRRIYLTPDGIAFPASVILPTLGDEQPLFLWLLVTQDEGGALQEAEARPVLRPWLSAPPDVWPDEGPLGDETGKSEAAARFVDAMGPFFAPGGLAPDDPKLFDLRLRRPLSLADFQWPLALERRDGGRKTVVKSSEHDDAVIETRGDALSLRLSERSVSGVEPPKSSLLILPDHVTLLRDRATQTVTLSGSTGGASQSSDRGNIAYSYQREVATEANPRERVKFDALRLHVPLRATRQALFGAEDGRKDNTRRVFLPVQQGWVENDFPTLSVTELAELDPTDPDKEDPAAQTVGAMGIGNAENAASRFENVWNVTVRGADQVVVKLDFRLDGDGVLLRDEIKVDLHGPRVASDGLLRIVAMEPSATRLLPDHPERALRARPIEAVDQTDLPLLERQVIGEVSVRLDNVNLDMALRRDADGIEELMLDQTDFDYVVSLPLADQSEPAIFWARHGALPTVQTQNLTQAGGDRRTPSGTRELAPLVIGEQPIPFEGQPADALRCAARQLSSVLDGALPGTQTQMTWNEQLGMAVTTLPSVTLMPLALKARRSQRRKLDAWKTDPNGWDGGVSAELRLRYDVALLDGPRASTELPNTEPENSNPAAAAEFETSVSKSSAARALSHWQSQFSSDVLSAVAWREVLAQRGESQTDLRLTGLGRGSFDLKPDVTLAPNLSPKDQALGSYSLTLDDEKEITFYGVPWSGTSSTPDEQSDVSGFSLQLQGKTFVGGSALLEPQDDVLEDQQGGQQSPARVVQAGRAHLVERAVAGAALDAPLRLVSTLEPLDFGELSLWLSDLAVDENGIWARDPILGPVFGTKPDTDTPSGARRMPNAHHPEHNVRIGHRWALSAADEDQPSDLGIALRGVLFRPIALSSAQLNTSTGATEFEIAGQIVMHVRSGHSEGEESQTVPTAVGAATLKLTRSAAGPPTVTLNADQLSIPVLDRQGSSAPISQLELDTVSFEEAGMSFAGASLHVPMLGHLFELKLLRDGAVQHPMTLIGDYPQGDKLSGLAPSAARVVLGSEPASGVVEATAAFALGFGGANGPRLVAERLNHDLMQQVSTRNGYQTVALSVPGLPPGKKVTGEAELTASGAAVSWRYDIPDGTEAIPVLPGLAVRASRGWALGAFQAPSVDATTKTKIALQDWQMDLRHWDTSAADIQTELRLVASLSEPETDWRLSGVWHVQNEIHFPLPDPSPISSAPADEESDWTEARFEQGFAAPVLHSATLYLVEHSLSPDALDRLAGRNAEAGESALQLGMLVAHQLGQTGQDPITWAQYQTVDIYDMETLRERLKLIETQNNDLVGWYNHEFSGLFSKDHAPKLLAAVGEEGPGIAFDFGALPCFGVPGDGFTLAQLPAFGVLGTALDISEDLAQVLNRALPPSAVVLSVPLVDCAIRFEGPAQVQLARRAGLLAGASAQYSHPLAQGHAQFIKQQLSVVKMPQWSAWQLRETQPYLAAGVGLSGLLAADTVGGTALSLMPMRAEDLTDLQDVQDAAAFFAALAEQRIDTFAVAFDGVSTAPDPVPERTGRVRAVSGATGKLIKPRPYAEQKDLLEEADYRRYLLQVADPSASIGVMLPPNDADAPRLASNQSVPSAARPVKVPGGQGGALATSERQLLAVAFKPGLAKEAPEIARRVTLGLSMQSATPEILAYPGPEAREDDEAAMPETLMRATRRSLRASLADTTTFLSGQDEAAWVSEMSRPLFRAAADPSEDGPASILFNAPQGSPLPVAYDPVGGDILPPLIASPELADTQDEAVAHPGMYLPAGVTVSRMSQGSGITYADRLGAAVFETGSLANVALRGRASNAPVFQRVPRPGQLGRKDQVRPSQFEAGHVLLSSQPVNTLYGRGIAQPIGPDLPVPDADMAFRVRLEEPMHGVLTPEWARRIAVSFEPLSDAASDVPFSKMDVSAVLVLGGAVYVLAQDAEDQPSKTKYFAAKEEVTVALSTLEEVETARVVLTATVGDFVRRLSVDLWAVGDGLPHLAERPLYFLFEDPALDELTRGVSHFAARSTEPGEVITGQPALSLRIATETQKITPTDSFTLIFGAIDPATNLEVLTSLDDPSSWSMKRIRPIPGQTEPPSPEDLSLLLRDTAPNIGQVVLGEAIEFDLTTDFVVPGVLKPGDTVQIEWTLDEKGDPFSFLLYIQVVATAPPSSNPASYAVLQAELAETGFAARCRCLLHQESADPTDRELVDSTRLLQGTAIFRNRFRWRAFLASGSAASHTDVRWAVQKIDGQGSTWLPPDVSKDWAKLRAGKPLDGE